MTDRTDRTAEFLDAVRAAADDHARSGAGPDPAAVLDAFAAHGLTIVSREAFEALGALAEPGGKQPPRWVVFEQVGHRRYACRLSVETEAGREVYRLYIPTAGRVTIKTVNPEMMYAVHDTTEEVVRHLAARWADAALPAAAYELPKAPAALADADPWRPGGPADAAGGDADGGDYADDYLDEGDD